MKRGFPVLLAPGCHEGFTLDGAVYNVDKVPSHIILCFAFFSLILTLGGTRQTGCWCFVLPGLVRLSRGYPILF